MFQCRRHTSPLPCAFSTTYQSLASSCIPPATLKVPSAQKNPFNVPDWFQHNIRNTAGGWGDFINVTCEEALCKLWSIISLLQLPRGGMCHLWVEPEKHWRHHICSFYTSQGIKVRKTNVELPEQLGIDTVLWFRKTLGFSHNFQAQNVYFSSF